MPNGSAAGPAAQASEQQKEEAAALADITGFVAGLQDAPGISLAAELPEELLSAVAALRALAARCAKAARKAAVTPEAAAQHRCLLSHQFSTLVMRMSGHCSMHSLSRASYGGPWQQTAL